MKRRDLLKGAAIAAAGAGALALGACGKKEEEKKEQAAAPATPAAPAIVKGKRELKMVTTWPKNFPGLGTGAQALADNITAMSDGS